jgi:hypothetical protein
LPKEQRIMDPYIRTPWNFKKANWGSFIDMLEINHHHHKKKDFSEHPDKTGKFINSSIINCAKACIPRGRVKRYKCFWTDALETLKSQQEYLRKTAERTGKTEDVQAWKRAEHTGKTEDVQAWKRQAAILRREITKSKRKSFKNFISHINYHKDSQKTYKYIARIQNNTPCSNKVPIHENNNVITRDRGIANTFACTFSRAQTKGTYARRESKTVKREYKTL